MHSSVTLQAGTYIIYKSMKKIIMGVTFFNCEMSSIVFLMGSRIVVHSSKKIYPCNSGEDVFIKSDDPWKFESSFHLCDVTIS